MDIPEFMFLSFQMLFKSFEFGKPNDFLEIYWNLENLWFASFFEETIAQPHVFSRLWWSLVKILESLHWLPGKFQKTLKCFSSFTQNSPRKGRKTLLYIFFSNSSKDLSRPKAKVFLILEETIAQAQGVFRIWGENQDKLFFSSSWWNSIKNLQRTKQNSKRINILIQKESKRIKIKILESSW